MSEISRQSFKSSIYSYLGTIIGFITVGYLFPKYLLPEEIGVLKLIRDYANIAGYLVAFGAGTTIIRFFPQFQNEKNGHNGLLSSSISLSIIGLIIFSVLFIFGKEWLIERNMEKSPIFAEYFNLIYPTTIALTLFIIFDAFYIALKRSTTGIFLRDFFQRSLILLLIIVYIVYHLKAGQLIYWYFGIIWLMSLIYFVKIYKTNRLYFKPRFSFLNKKLITSISSVGAFSILNQLGVNLAQRLDIIMINEFIGEAMVGIYATLFYYSSLIRIPTININRAVSSHISQFMHDGDLHKMNELNKKTALNQFLIGVVLFCGIWINKTFVFFILPDEYAIGEYILLYAGLAEVLRTLTGNSNTILIYSRYYRHNFLFMLGYSAVIIVFNLFLIPLYGIAGAALATALSALLLYTSITTYAYIRLKANPLSLPILWVALIGVVAFGVASLIYSGNVYADLIIRSGVFLTLFSAPVLYFKISPDLNYFILNHWNAIKRRL